MLSQHFLNTQNGRYVIDYQIGFNLNCEAFKFDIIDESNFLLKVDTILIKTQFVSRFNIRRHSIFIEIQQCNILAK